MLGIPPRSFAYRLECRLELARQHVEVVDGAGVGVHGVDHADVDRVHADLFGEHVEPALEGESRLRHAMPAHRPARRSVRVHPPPVVTVVGNVVERRDHESFASVPIMWGRTSFATPVPA